MPTLYSIKPAFQNLLRPLAASLVKLGATANMVTVAAAILSVATGALVAACHQVLAIFWTIPVVLLLRMALNAVDGMMAREFGQASKLGLYLNELTDIVSDAALILPFALLPFISPWCVFVFALLAAMTEYAGVLGAMAGGTRRYDGPLGKSDRALALGVTAALIAADTATTNVLNSIFAILSVLSVLTIVNRARAGLQELRP